MMHNATDILFLLVPITAALIIGFVFYLFYKMFTSGYGPFNFIRKIIVPDVRKAMPRIVWYQKIAAITFVACLAVVFSRVFAFNSPVDLVMIVGVIFSMFTILFTTYLRVLVYFFS